MIAETKNDPPSAVPGSGMFPRTRWTQVGNVRSADTNEFSEALDYLTDQYWQPIFRYIQRQGNDEQRSKDLTQSFILHCLEKSVFARAEQERGRFRSFLLTSLKNFMTTAHRRERAQSRRPAGGLVSLESMTSGTSIVLEPSVDESPEESFYRSWIANLIEKAVAQLQEEARLTNRQAHFKLFKERLVAPALYGSPRASVKEMAAEVGIDEKTASNCITSMKRRFKTLLQDEVRLFADSDDEVTNEITDMLHFLGN